MEDKITIADMLTGMRRHWPEIATPETATMLGLIRLNDLVAENTNKAIAPLGLTPAAFEVLVTLRAQPAPRQLTPTALYRSILITSGGMTKVLKHLEAAGAITRIDDPGDRRSRLVKLTAVGKRLAEKAMAAVMQADRSLLSRALTDKDARQLHDTLLGALAKLERPPAKADR